MKKYILLAIIAIAAVFNTFAEQGDASAAAQFVYASKNSMAGLGAQVQYEPIAHFRLAPEFIYFFESDKTSAINVNMNLHYIIPTSPSFAIYPLAGFSYARYKVSNKVDLLGGDHSFDRCGANIGMGAEYRVQERLSVFSEERFQVMKDYNQSVTVLGIKYTF